MAEPQMTEAQRRAAARKAKILARGNAGLQRLAQTARGEDADKLYGDDTPTSSAPASRPETPVTASSDKKPGWAPESQRQPQAQPPTSETPEDMQAQFDAMMRMLGGNPGAPGEAPPDMNNLFAQLMGGMPPGAEPNLLTDSGARTPLDPTQNPFGNMPPFGMGMPGMPGMTPPRPPSKAARFFPLLHAIAVIALVVFVAGWWEPTLALVRWGGLSGERTWAVRWSSLAGRAGAYSVKSVEPLPVFYAFMTLEAILFATRVTLLQTPPALHPLLANVLPMLPPNISSLVITGSKYLGVASQVYADGCLFVFGLGCAIVLAEYMAK